MYSMEEEEQRARASDRDIYRYIFPLLSSTTHLVFSCSRQIGFAARTAAKLQDTLRSVHLSQTTKPATPPPAQPLRFCEKIVPPPVRPPTPTVEVRWESNRRLWSRFFRSGFGTFSLAALVLSLSLSLSLSLIFCSHVSVYLCRCPRRRKRRRSKRWFSSSGCYGGARHRTKCLLARSNARN